MAIDDDEFENTVEVDLAFPEGPPWRVLLRGVPRVGETFSWKPPPRRRPRAGQFIVTKVEWVCDSRRPGEVVVHLERKTKA